MARMRDCESASQKTPWQSMILSLSDIFWKAQSSASASVRPSIVVQGRVFKAQGTMPTSWMSIWALQSTNHMLMDVSKPYICVHDVEGNTCILHLDFRKKVLTRNANIPVNGIECCLSL